MALPTPTPGLVICYSYLWTSEHHAGRDEGRKNSTLRHRRGDD